jgi:hypothetical protein
MLMTATAIHWMENDRLVVLDGICGNRMRARCHYDRNPLGAARLVCAPDVKLQSVVRNRCMESATVAVASDVGLWPDNRITSKA